MLYDERLLLGKTHQIRWGFMLALNAVAQAKGKPTEPIRPCLGQGPSPACVKTLEEVRRLEFG